MIKIIGYALKIAVVVAIGYWLGEHPGDLTLEWQGQVIETTTPVVALILLVLIILTSLIYHGYKRLAAAPGRFGSWRHGKKRSQGYEALTKGLISVAAGDGNMAGRQANKARKLLKDAPLTLLLSAQAAQISGDVKAAQDSYRAMVEHPDLAFFGLRGLLNQELKTNGRRDVTGAVNRNALKLARDAFRLEPTSTWVVETLYDLETIAENYDRALGLVDQMRRIGMIDKVESKHKRGIIMMARSLAAETYNRHRDALNFVAKAVKLAPTFAPAAARYARLLAKEGKLRKARAVIDSAWQINPHPELIAVWKEFSPYEDAEGRLRWMRRLCTGKTNEDRLGIAPLLLENAQWNEARTLLTEALENKGGIRVLRLLADLEIKEANDSFAAGQWLSMAEERPPAPCWVSLETGATQSVWTPFSVDTGRFDILHWLVPAPAGTNVKALASPDAAPAKPAPPPATQTIDAQYQEVEDQSTATAASQ